MAALVLARRHGWIPLSDVITRFRQLPDLRAYLQAAAFTEYLIERYGAKSLERLWREGTSTGSLIGGETLAAVETRWKRQLTASRRVSSSTLARVEDKGCG